jgi:hypothetical protein
MSDDEFNSLCNAHGFGAVASGECPLVSSGMLKVLVDAAYQAGQKAADGQIKALRFILREVLENDSYESLHNNNNLDDELKQRIEAAIGCKPEGER